MRRPRIRFHFEFGLSFGGSPKAPKSNAASTSSTSSSISAALPDATDLNHNAKHQQTTNGNGLVAGQLSRQAAGLPVAVLRPIMGPDRDAFASHSVQNLQEELMNSGPAFHKESRRHERHQCHHCQRSLRQSQQQSQNPRQPPNPPSQPVRSASCQAYDSRYPSHLPPQLVRASSNQAYDCQSLAGARSYPTLPCVPTDARAVRGTSAPPHAWENHVAPPPYQAGSSIVRESATSRPFYSSVSPRPMMHFRLGDADMPWTTRPLFGEDANDDEDDDHYTHASSATTFPFGPGNNVETRLAARHSSPSMLTPDQMLDLSDAMPPSSDLLALQSAMLTIDNGFRDCQLTSSTLFRGPVTSLAADLAADSHTEWSQLGISPEAALVVTGISWDAWLPLTPRPSLPPSPLPRKHLRPWHRERRRGRSREREPERN